QQVILFLSDFSFRNPLEIFKELQTESSKTPEIKRMGMNIEDHLNDVKYDAFLTNWRTLSNPEIISVNPEQMVRLRIIDGSSSSNFFIDLGKLEGEVIAIDGSDIQPIKSSSFQIGIAQRIDLLLQIPAGSGSYPIIAQGEGTNMQ